MFHDREKHGSDNDCVYENNDNDDTGDNSNNNTDRGDKRGNGISEYNYINNDGAC